MKSNEGNTSRCLRSYAKCTTSTWTHLAKESIVVVAMDNESTTIYYTIWYLTYRRRILGSIHETLPTQPLGLFVIRPIRCLLESVYRPSGAPRVRALDLRHQELLTQQHSWRGVNADTAVEPKVTLLQLLLWLYTPPFDDSDCTHWRRHVALRMLYKR